ncbi:MAG: Prophage regulatory protein (AlpA) [Rickettsiaceae bacterium]|jgi:prophage regulatory protein|nr:Prophage regulatory protein (AlpA) [Rickettsiaceae bacterium]
MIQKESTSSRRVLRLWEVVELTKLSPSWIYAQIKAGKFPANFKIFEGGRACGWWASDIENFLESRDARRA